MTASDSVKTRLVDRFDSTMQSAKGLEVDIDENIKKDHISEKIVDSNDGDEEMDGSDVQEEVEEGDADNDADSQGNQNDAEGGNDEKVDNNDQEESLDEEEEEEDEEEEEEGDGKTMVQVGGRQKEKAYALLDGVIEDSSTGVKSRVTIPITRIPATLGRTHDTDDPHFFGLGKIKALSRRQCRICKFHSEGVPIWEPSRAFTCSNSVIPIKILLDYRDPEGGQVGQWDRSSQTMSYKEPADVEKEGTTAPSSSANMTVPIANSKLIKPSGEKAKSKPPSTGFFAIESLGKNRILVDRDRVDQGFSARLESGSAIRISSYMLYFLLPTDAQPKTYFVKDPNAPAGGATKKAGKKRKTPTQVPSSVPSSPAGSAANKKPKTSGSSQQTDLDSIPVDALIEQMDDAVKKGEWQRSTQLIGSSICYHAVRDAARDAGIQEEAVDVGVSRTSIMSWIETSDRYSEWVKQMLSKMEARSYQAAITKSLLKAGFTRTGTSGRYIKWLLPKDIPITFSKKSPKKKKSPAPPASPGNKSPKKKAAAAASPKAPPVKEEEEEQDDAEEESEEEEQEDDGSNQEGNESGDDENEEQEEEEQEEEADGDDEDDEAGDNDEKEDAEDSDEAEGDKEAADDGDDDDNAEDEDDNDEGSDDDGDEEGSNNAENKDDDESGDENNDEE